MPYVTYATAAKNVGMSRHSIRTGVQKGEIKCRDSGRAVLVDLEDVQKYAEALVAKRLGRLPS